MHREVLISQICGALKLNYEGADIKIDGLNLCNRESKHRNILSFAENDNFIENIRENKAVRALVLRQELAAAITKELKDRKLTFIVCGEPENVFYDIHNFLYYETDFYDKYEFESKVGEGSHIHSSAVIEQGVVLGKNVKIGANSVVKKGSVIMDNCTIGCNSTIGSEGFQIVKMNKKNRKIVHCGGVFIAEGVNIGDNVTVCNSLFENTTHIEENVMIDNQAYVGHNVIIKKSAVITAGTILCGSSVVGEGAWIGVNSSVLNRVKVGNDSKIGIGSVVTRDIPDGNLAYGAPAKVKTIFLGGGVWKPAELTAVKIFYNIKANGISVTATGKKISYSPPEGAAFRKKERAS